MDPASIVENTEQTCSGLQMDRPTDGQWNQYIPLNFVVKGYNNRYNRT